MKTWIYMAYDADTDSYWEFMKMESSMIPEFTPVQTGYWREA